MVRDALRRRGHDAYSCDILGSRGDSAWHITGDVFKAIKKRGPWDAAFFFPPCTYVTVAANRWLKEQHGRIVKQRAALEFMRDLLERDIDHIAMENPIGVFSSYWRKPDQIVQPWMFGHKETKATCFWLKNLPKLKPTLVVGPPPYARGEEGVRRGSPHAARREPGARPQRDASRHRRCDG